VTRARAVVLLGVAFAATSCGVRDERGVERANPDDVPFGLLEEDREPVAAPLPGPRSAAELYFVDDDGERLVPIERLVASDSVSGLLAELESGTTDAESASGLRSALTDAEAIASVGIEGGVAIIDMTESFRELGGDDQLVAIAQMVFTLTGRSDVDEVSFTLAGEPVEVPRGDGSLTSGTLGRDDYESLAPPGPVSRASRAAAATRAARPVRPSLA